MSCEGDCAADPLPVMGEGRVRVNQGTSAQGDTISDSEERAF
jgi:hypothetical protein